MTTDKGVRNVILKGNETTGFFFARTDLWKLKDSWKIVI